MTSSLLLGMLICHIPISYCSRKKIDWTQVLLVVIPILLWIAKVAYQILMVIVIHRQLFLTRTIFLDRMSVYASGKEIGVGDFCRKVLRCLSKHGSKKKKRKKTKKTWWFSTNACSEGVGPLKLMFEPRACQSLYSYTPYSTYICIFSDSTWYTLYDF